MPASSTLTTDLVAPRERAAQWRAWVWEQFGGLESDLYGDSDFDGHLSRGCAGEVIMTRLEANRHRVLRTAQLARASDAGYLKIVAPWRGRAGVQQHQREVWVADGGWTVYDTTQAYSVANPDRCEHLIVMVPRERLEGDGLRIAPLLARHAGGAAGVSRLALDAMRSTYRELPHMTAQAAHGAGEVLVQLLRLSLAELAGCHTAQTRREALKDRLRQHVRQRLRDPNLSIDGIATALHCSKRHLHELFAEESDTLAAYILRQRLEGCMLALQAPARAGESITAIALSWGFASSAHFSRVFRAHTGMSPTDHRHAPAAGESLNH